MPYHHLCVLNAGSSSLKFAVFGVAGSLPRLQSGVIERIDYRRDLLVLRDRRTGRLVRADMSTARVAF